MASHPLIDRYLADLTGRLPADAVDELADGLVETWHHHHTAGLDPTRAAEAAIAEFGSADEVTAAFVLAAPGRSTARLLMATGPVAGLCWGTSLVAARAWTWPVPAAVAAVFAVGLVATVAALATAATSRSSYRRTRLGGAGGLLLIILDLAMLAAVASVVAVTAAAFGWPMLAAATVSIVRIALTVRALPHVLCR